MTIKEYDTVRVLHQGKAFEGTIVSCFIDAGKDNKRFWWVKFQKDGITEANIVDEDDIIKWNTEVPCVCGALATDQPGHSYYCDYRKKL